MPNKAVRVCSDRTAPGTGTGTGTGTAGPLPTLNIRFLHHLRRTLNPRKKKGEKGKASSFLFAMRASSLLRTVRGNGLAGIPSSFLQEAGRGNGCSCGMKTRSLSSIVETLSDYERDQPSDAATMMKKEASLHHALGQLADDFDRESNLSLSRFFRTRYAPAISTGSLMLDLALGIGGLPKGRIVEIYGREASGKTTLALHVVKEAQKLGGNCAYLDVENALDSLYAEQMGVKTEDLLIAHPNSAESSLGIVNTLINSGSLDVIVVDSVAALVPQCELDGMININSEDVQSRLMTQALRKIHYSLSRSQTLVIFVNQVRTNLRYSGGLGQENVVACGGKALKFYSAVRMKLLRRDLLHNEDKVTGIGISVQVMKNKLAPPMKMASLDIEFGRGVRREVEVLEMACKHGLVMREGNGYWIKGDFFQNQTVAEEYLLEYNNVADELVSMLREQLFGLN